MENRLLQKLNPYRRRGKKFLYRALFFSAAVSALFSCGPREGGNAGSKDAASVPAESLPAEAILTDVSGKPYEGKLPAGRIISLVPAVTEILFAVGAGDRVAAVTEYCNYPPEALEKPKAGGFSGASVSIETVTALKPDLVLLSGDMHARIRGMLEELSIPCFAVEPRNFEETYAAIETIGRLSGCVEGAEKVIEEMKSKIALAAEKIPDGKKPKVYWELSADPMMSTGGGTFINEAIEKAGGVNIFGDLAQSWPQISSEAVLDRQPDWILTGEDPYMKTDISVFASRPGWNSIPAVRNGCIATVNSDSLYRYGPRLADAVLDISSLLFGKDK
ncbi:MAG: ABC transporter substrate-binding protein [Treponema sp.]|jgi:iron complex transport system substrate-binding protein|nr:ABC transporter substrate-binding protein [Treponema sp.]